VTGSAVPGGAVPGSAVPGPVVSGAAVVAVRAARLRRRRRAWAVSGVLLAMLTAVALLALATGRSTVPVATVVSTLLGQDTGAEFTVLSLRLPRAVGAILVGAALGLSGAIFQSLLQNPLASPDVLGVTTGASAAAVVAVLGFQAGGVVVALAALGGAAATALLIYALAWRRGVTGYRFVLVGIGVAAVLSAVISYQLTATRVEEAQQALLWLTGSLHSVRAEDGVRLAVALAVLLPLTGVAARRLVVLQLGDEAAGGLGVQVERSRLALVAVAVALVAVATATAGPVGFVALVAPPIARRLVPTGLALVPSALVGALVVLAADQAGQLALADVRLPVGVVTGLVGGPYLLWLLVRANREGRL
jgi:iron complex transport system permease protein